MRRLQVLQTYIILCLLNVAGLAYGQVTIGSDKNPVNGAILQLKEYDNPTGANSTRGLNLPRVSLSDLGKLKMGTDPEISSGSDRLNHTGLAIYNVAGNYCQETPIRVGPYVWNGERWNYLGTPTEMIFKDQEGNDFKAGDFGTAGIWMTQNLNVKTYADGTAIAPYDHLPVIDKVAYTYPNVTDAAANTTPPADWRPTQGLLYTSAAALKGYLPTVLDQRQVQGTTPGPNEIETVVGKVQGICPTGWHVPSDREWNQLEKEIYSKMSQYSTYVSTDTPTPAAWNEEWEWNNTRFERPYTPIASGTHGHGLAMASSCAPFNSVAQGKSRSSFNGGFDIMLLGNVNGLNGGSTSTVGNYRVYGYLWSSSSVSSQGLILRRVGQFFPAAQDYSNTFVYRAPGDRQILLSVRCKKD